MSCADKWSSDARQTCESCVARVSSLWLNDVRKCNSNSSSNGNATASVSMAMVKPGASTPFANRRTDWWCGCDSYIISTCKCRRKTNRADSETARQRDNATARQRDSKPDSVATRKQFKRPFVYIMRPDLGRGIALVSVFGPALDMALDSGKFAGPRGYKTNKKKTKETQPHMKMANVPSAFDHKIPFPSSTSCVWNNSISARPVLHAGREPLFTCV